MLLGKLLPREGHFFELFNLHGACIGPEITASRCGMRLP